jgi:tetratricopeptide (TPR) repeat protein
VRIRNMIAAPAAMLALAAAMTGQTSLTQSSQGAPGPSTTTPNAYIPGTTYQAANPNYMTRSPFYFEGRVDWNLLNITTPSGPWEYTQRGIHYQDDLLDSADAINDYQTAINLNSLSNGTCQLVTVAVTNTTVLNPAPCMFTPRLRLAHLIKGTNPTMAISLFQQVLQIDPLRLGINAYIGEVYISMAQNAAAPAAADPLYNQAIAAFKAELALSPVTANTIKLTGDLANNAHVHWSLAEVYEALDDPANEATELQAYLNATQWHSDTYAWHIQLAKVRLAKLQSHLRRAGNAR